MTQDESKDGVELFCGRCGNKWLYKGNSTWYASCSRCHGNVKVPMPPVWEFDGEDE